MDQSQIQEQQVDIYPLALAKFLQVAPELGANILSFKDISEDLPQNNDIKVGVFILRTGTELFYVPVVSKAENIYPIDSVFQASKNMFFPLTRKMVDMVLTASKNTVGKPVKIPKEVNQNPDMTTLVTPPRTGKFAYASSSRLTDFLAAMPGYLKNFALEKVAAEKSVYEELNKLFPIQEIFAALKTPAQSMARVSNEAPISVVTGAAATLSDEEVAEILEHGYAVNGSAESTRVAVTQLAEAGKFTHVSNLDGDSDFELVLNNGTCREAFIPKIVDLGRNAHTDTVAIFTNGAYAVSKSFIASGDRLDRKHVLGTVFEHNPPVLPRDLNNDEEFAVIDTDANLIGLFRAHRVVLSNLGVDIQVNTIAGAPTCVRNIVASHNYGAKPSIIGHTLYMPFSSLVVRLKGNLTTELEISINSAAKRNELSLANLMGDQLNIGYDGVEFSVNNRALGSEESLMRRLAVEESIEPGLASSFIKEAKEKKFLKVYLSKKASNDFKPAEHPQYGEKPATVPKTGLNGSFIPNVQSALKIGDAQSTEATIISELLQAPDMFELIEEYQPELEQCIDKLGRILFLSRVNINQLAEGNDIDSVFAFLASLKSTYRMLGDNYIKLNEMLAIKPDVTKR